MKRCSLLVVLCTTLAFLSAAAAQQRYVGSVALVPFNFAPQGTLLCNGQLLPISQYDVLFNLVGTTYGGDGQSTFALPDLRGRVAIGMGQGPGLSPYSLGQTGGEESVTLQLSQLPTHNHTALAVTAVGNTVSPLSDYWAAGPRVLLYSAPTNLTPAADFAVGPAGGSGAHENRKPFLALNYVIWWEGIYPSQN